MKTLEETLQKILDLEYNAASFNQNFKHPTIFEKLKEIVVASHTNAHTTGYNQGVRESAEGVRSLKMDMNTLIAELEGVYQGLMTHPESENTTGFVISIPSKEKLTVLKDLVTRYKKNL